MKPCSFIHVAIMFSIPWLNPHLCLGNDGASSGDPSFVFLNALKSSSARGVLADPSAGNGKSLKISRNWNGNLCQSRITNAGKYPLRIQEIILFDLDHQLPPTTPIHAESFQMLAQIIGTLGTPEDLGAYPDYSHYRIPEPHDMRAACGMMTLAPTNSPRILLGFSSCRKFIGRFYFNSKKLQVVLDTENLELSPGQSWTGEEFLIMTAPDRESLFDTLTAAVEKNHPRLRHDPIPAGWCSWYCYGPDVTSQNIMDNLDYIAKKIPSLKYIQIDDGYQAHMGDWLETGKAFGGGIQNVLQEIRRRGFEPAIWVAPFIADKDSRLFQEHPDWFVKGSDGKPLSSDTVGFGGWRMAPWYCLDGTHPEAQHFLENLFRILRQEWGCTYFKLDATYWGAIHSGKHFDPHATRVEAYRRGMEAILRGAGDSFILGCNHPLWPSLGLIHGSRTSMDIDRTWKSFTSIGRESLYRNWMNRKFWWNDPDCVVLTGNLTDNEYLFHATLIYATGGMVLSGDDLTKISPSRLAILYKLIPPTGIPFRFENEFFSIGHITLPDREMFAVFNSSDQPVSQEITLPYPARLTDYWTDEELGTHQGRFSLPDMPPHSARLLSVHRL